MGIHKYIINKNCVDFTKKKGKVLTVFIAGTTPYADNRGNSAIFRGILEFLGHLHGYKLEVYVWHTFPESMSRYYKRIATTNSTSNKNIHVEIIPRKIPSKPLRAYIIYAFKLPIFIFAMMFLRSLRLLPSKFSIGVEVLNEILASDFIIELNFGDTFTDVTYGKIVWLSNVLRMALLLLSKKPLYMFPQSIGPIKSPFNRAVARIMLNRAKIVAVREPYSLANAINMGIRKDRLKLVPDMSFLTPAISDNEALRILGEESCIECNKMLIGILLSPKLLTWGTSSREIAYVIDRLIEQFNATVLFIPHGTSVHAGFDCRMFCLQVRNMLKNKERTIILTKEHTVEELWGVIRLCDIIISTLGHPVIASLKLGVPVIALSYSHKTPGIMKLFNMERFALKYDEFNKVSGMVGMLLEDINLLKRKLIKQVTSIEEMIARFRQEFTRDMLKI